MLIKAAYYQFVDDSQTVQGYLVLRQCVNYQAGSKFIHGQTLRTTSVTTNHIKSFHGQVNESEEQSHNVDESIRNHQLVEEDLAQDLPAEQDGNKDDVDEDADDDRRQLDHPDQDEPEVNQNQL